MATMDAIAPMTAAPRTAPTAVHGLAWHARWLLAQVVLNAAVTAWIGRAYFVRLPDGLGVGARAAVGASWLGVCAALAVAVGALAAPVTLAARRGWATFGVAPALFIAAQFVIYVDTVVFGLFRFHLNGVVLHLLTTPGAGDSWTAGRATIVRIAASVAAIALVVIALPIVCARRRWPFPRTGWSIAILVAAVVVERGVYAWSPHRALAQSVLPLYQGDAWRRFARSALHLDVAVGDAVVPEDAAPLDYPRHPLAFRADAERLNVVLVAVECGRSDMLDPAVMPFLAQWSTTQITCADHWSGGDCTRFGLCAALFGLDGACFAQLLAHTDESALIAALRARGYDCEMRSCGDLHYPELRQTAFSRLAPDRLHDTWTCARVDRDRTMTDGFVSELATRPRPFFSFVFYDASHQPYLYPDEFARFAPVTDLAKLDYVALSQDASAAAVAPLFNRYRNSLGYVDAQIRRLVEGLERSGDLERTIVIVFGDHGEEFGEGGHVGHAIAYTPWQCRPFCVAHIPGEAARVVRRPTAHVDFLPTVLTRLGCLNPVGDYSVGTPLTAAEGPRELVLSGWNDAAVVDADGIVVFATTSGCMDLQAFDRAWRPQPDGAARRQDLLARTLTRLRSFSR